MEIGGRIIPGSKGREIPENDTPSSERRSSRTSNTQMSGARTIVFAGHFTVGTIVSGVERRTMAAAVSQEGDLALLVNDMGMFRRTLLYETYGALALMREVRRIPRCGMAFSCGANGFADEALENIDWPAYDAARARMAGCANVAAKQEALRSLIVELVSDRILSHRLDPAKVRVFFERQLRNAASARLRNRTVGAPASWRSILAAAGLLDDVLVPLSRIPTCGAILTALYERLVRAGYRRVIQFYDIADQDAIENGERLYRILSAAKGWRPLEIESSFFSTSDFSTSEDVTALEMARSS